MPKADDCPYKKTSFLYFFNETFNSKNLCVQIKIMCVQQQCKFYGKNKKN